MKKFIYLFIIGMLFGGFVAYENYAEAKGPTGPAGKSNKAHLYLYEKDPTSWEIVSDGAWGKMTYDQSGELFSYVFNGHHLNPNEDYTLIYYPDPWPGTGLICLGEGTANDGGNIHLMGSENTGVLPAEYDANKDGAKIWLVKSTDVDCATTLHWNVVGSWKWLVLGIYEHDLIIEIQSPDGTFAAYGGYPADNNPYTSPGQTPELITNGKVIDNQITFTTTYLGPYNPGYSVTVTGTINPDGTITGTGPWAWHSTFGKAVAVPDSKMVGWNPNEYLFEYDLINFVTE